MAYEGKPASVFVETEIVQQHLALATEHVGRAAAKVFRRSMEGSLRNSSSLRFDSPLEVLFWTWWEAVVGMNETITDLISLRPQAEVTIGEKLYQVDFVVQPIRPEIALSPDWQPIAVELDGHAFHERTREQVTYRDQRDRALQSAGWRVFHFSFSEFTAKPLESVAEVVTFAKANWGRALDPLFNSVDLAGDH